MSLSKLVTDYLGVYILDPAFKEQREQKDEELKWVEWRKVFWLYDAKIK